MLCIQFHSKFGAKLNTKRTVLHLISDDFFSNDVESFNFVEEGDDEKQQLMIICSCYNGVRGLCTHILATEMYLCQRKRPSEEKMLSNRRKKGRLPKNSKIQKF